MNDILITPLFEEKKEALRSKLANLSGERAGQEAEKIVKDFLEDYFGPQSAFKRKLPDPERFLINSVLAFLEAQGDFLKAQGDLLAQGMPQIEQRPVEMKQPLQAEPDYPTQLLRDGLVALTAGGIASIGIWWVLRILIGVPAGIIVGQGVEAVRKKRVKSESRQADSTPSSTRTKPDMQKVADSIVDAVANVCKCFDDILKTYRVQLSNATQREEKTFESQNRLLTSQIQTILGAAYATNPEDVEDARDLIDECSRLEKMLSNEGLHVMKYSGKDKSEDRFFQFSQLDGLTAPEMELPAIVRGDVAVVPGQVNIPKS